MSKMNWCFSHILFVLVGFLLLSGCVNRSQNGSEDSDSGIERIVALKGAYSETVYALGFGDKLVATDVTSTYPEAVEGLPKLGHIRSITAEGILSQNPDLIIADPSEMAPAVLDQLWASKVRLLLIEQELSLEGTRALVRQIGSTLEADNQVVNDLVSSIGVSESVVGLDPSPRVLFIYARGAGSMTVAGANTPMHSMIELAGGTNATSNVENYKPLTTESLVAADPEIILLFSSSWNSLQGVEGIMAIPGMSSTTAGRNKAVITMDGYYLSGFGPRVGSAIEELNTAFRKSMISHE